MKSYILTICLISFVTVYGQCPNPDRFIKVKGEKNGYSENSQSRSGYVRVGEVFETVFITQDANEYRLTINPYDKDAGNLKYEIYEMVVEKRLENGKSVYKKVKQVLYSSADDQSIEIRSDGTRKIYVKVMMEGEDKDRLECVGILVEHKRAKKVGF